jgi:predicted unusual protein kinase regulating ubiquinone biosynthesis (AarF/ABC1/UbiB family)
MSDTRSIPGSKLGRLARLASVGMRTGASMIMSRDGSGAAQQAAEVLGTMRGVAAKIGQMAAYVDGVIPEAHRGAYEASMKGLLAAAPKSPPDKVRALLEAELTRPVGAVFAEFDDEPLASASIGQVHRGRLHDGREVAVKVQHPEVARAVESDLRNAGLVEALIGTVAGKKFESKRILEEVRARFREELDYRLEAARQREFAALHASDPTVIVPSVIDELSTGRVLVSSFERGMGFEDACAASEELRSAWCGAMWRFVYKGTLIGGMFNADPHPGNYAFRSDGTVVFFDYGCIQPVPEKRRLIARRSHLAAVEGDVAAFRRYTAEMLETRGGDYERRALDYVQHCFEPVFASPFRFTREYSVAVVEHMKEVFQSSRKAKDDAYVALPEGVFFLNRLQFGFYSVLGRMAAPVDYRSIEREMLAPFAHELRAGA